MQLADQWARLSRYAGQVYALRTPETLGELLARAFAEVVTLERVLAEASGPAEVSEPLAAVAIRVLEALHVVDRPWTLRGPRHQTGIYCAASELTAPLRQALAVVVEHWAQGEARDVTIALELALKAALELASRLDFDLGLAVSAILRSALGHASLRP